MALTKVTKDVLGDNEVGAAHISDNSVNSSELADNAVTSSKISANAVTSSKISANAVTESKIANNSVSGQKIAMGSDAQGDILFRGASGYERLAKGAAGQKLQMNSGATAPEWADDSTYRAGEVIEEIALIQNGSSQTVLSGTYTAGNVTVKQEPGDTYVDMTGSSISYTPPSSASRVVYSLIFYASYASGATSIAHFRLYLDSNEVTRARTSFGGTYFEGVYTISWPFEIGGSANTSTGKVASWSSAKQIKVQTRRSSSSYPMRLHETYNWDSSPSTNLHPPIINIRAIK